MKYSISVKIKSPKNHGSIKGFASVVLDNVFKITNILIEQNNITNELFISMPRFNTGEVNDKGLPVWKDVCHPLTADFRDELSQNILATYKNAVEGKKEVLEVDNGAQEELEFTLKLQPFKNPSNKVLATGHIYIDSFFIIENVRLLNGKNGPFIAFPACKTKGLYGTGKIEFKDICYPMTKELRKKLSEAAFENVC